MNADFALKYPRVQSFLNVGLLEFESELQFIPILKNPTYKLKKLAESIKEKYGLENNLQIVKSIFLPLSLKVIFF